MQDFLNEFDDIVFGGARDRAVFEKFGYSRFLLSSSSSDDRLRLEVSSFLLRTSDDGSVCWVSLVLRSLLGALSVHVELAFDSLRILFEFGSG